MEQRLAMFTASIQDFDSAEVQRVFGKEAERTRGMAPCSTDEMRASVW